MTLAHEVIAAREDLARERQTVADLRAVIRAQDAAIAELQTVVRALAGARPSSVVRADIQIH